MGLYMDQFIIFQKWYRYYTQQMSKHKYLGEFVTKNYGTYYIRLRSIHEKTTAQKSYATISLRFNRKRLDAGERDLF